MSASGGIVGDATGPQLADDPIEGGRAPLCASEVIVGARCIPEELEWPAIGAMAEQAAEREPHLDRIDAALG